MWGRKKIHYKSERESSHIGLGWKATILQTMTTREEHQELRKRGGLRKVR